MKPLALIIPFLVFCFYQFAAGQNLVPNPSFEEHTDCPEGYPDLDGICNDWFSCRESPDYFNICSSTCNFYNVYGHQEPHFGEAYAGIITYGVTIPNIREYLGVQLTSPLIIGQKYYINFFVSTAWNYTGMNIATNNMGALFTTYPFLDLTADLNLPNFTHVKSDSVIKDTLSWTKISGSFIADSSYTHINIGNFYDDSNTDTLNLPFHQIAQRSYYYIDDICVSNDSIYANNWLGYKQNLNDTQFLIYPNPISDCIKIQSNKIIESIQIINGIGNILLSVDNLNNSNLNIPVNLLSEGIYNLKINTQFTTFYKQILII